MRLSTIESGNGAMKRIEIDMAIADARSRFLKAEKLKKIRNGYEAASRKRTKGIPGNTSQRLGIIDRPLLELAVHDQCVDEAEFRMLKSFGKAADNFKVEALPKPDCALVRADH